ncbi:hypothetical protein [Actinomadura rugatobispora]|uniref:CopG family transcriptional regulator n=1 Tax=Actinomadura rugatobispora TaxID=1994 RepID=A0ABW0ZMX3_9ACTN|nr:hypothetical protein GCM10010200_059660 [Actinomadura rugatobispora]
MSDQERARIGRKAVAFDAFLDHMPTERNPKGGDKNVFEKALDVLAEEPKKTRRAKPTKPDGT